MPFNVNNNTVVTDDRIVQSVSGAVGARPGTPVTGMTFFNTTDSIMEVYNGTAWISSTTGGGGGAVPNAWSWGTGTFGQLGINITNTSRSSPVSVVGGITDWISVSVGSYHTVGVRANGTAWAWGSNGSGRLGDNTTTNRSSPVSIVGGFTDWTSISAGRLGHNVGLRANGTLWAWGYNNRGQVGDTTLVSKLSPVSVVGGFTDWTSASAGALHSLGIRANGILYAWGYGTFGRLGDNTASGKLSPVSVVGGFVNWINASAGSDHSLGVRANGTLWAWGRNNYGKIGDNIGGTLSRSSPVSVVGGFVDWVSASAGGTQSLGVRANGTLWAWGSGGNGKLGDNSITNRSSPVSVVGGFTDWVSASAGYNHSLGVRANGTLWAWGYNFSGQLGDGTAVDKSSPVSVVGSFTNWLSASGGRDHTAGIRSS